MKLKFNNRNPIIIGKPQEVAGFIKAMNKTFGFFPVQKTSMKPQPVNLIVSADVQKIGDLKELKEKVIEIEKFAEKLGKELSWEPSETASVSNGSQCING